MKKLTSAIGLSALLLAGCGGANVRQQEKNIAEITIKFQTGTRDFTKVRAAIVEARQRGLNHVEMAALETRQRVEGKVSLLRFEDEKRVKIYEQIVTETNASGERADAIAKLRGDHRAALANAKTRVAIDQAKLAAVIKALAKIGTEKTPEEQLEFYLQYFGAMEKKLEELKDEASKETKNADEKVKEGIKP